MKRILGLHRPLLRSLSVPARRAHEARHFGNALSRPRYFVHPFDNLVNDFHRQIDRVFNEPVVWPSSWWSAPVRTWRLLEDNPIDAEAYRIANPIVEVDGKKMFKLEFDVRRFSPSEVCVKTKNGRLIVSAKHSTPSNEEGEVSCRFEMHREMTLPQGVDARGIQSEYSDGVLTIEAPYTPPPEIEEKAEKMTPKKERIDVKHE